MRNLRPASCHKVYKGYPGRAETNLKKRGGSGRNLPAFFYSTSKMQFCAADHPYLTKKAFSASEMDVQVAVTKNEPMKSFRKAVLIVIATESMKNSSSSLFSDEDLMDILSTILEPVTFDIYGRTEATSSIYQAWQNFVYNIEDADHKSLILKEPAQLVAMHLQGPNIKQAVQLKMSVYRPKNEAGTRKLPVVLGIQKGKFYISCVRKAGQPVLQLEEVTIQGDLDKSQMGRFLFYKIGGEKQTRFESAECPEWFICTSTQSEKAVAMTNQPGGPQVIVDYSLTSPENR